jgi:hypothetical protein
MTPLRALFRDLMWFLTPGLVTNPAAVRVSTKTKRTVPHRGHCQRG